jgi:N-methylhydantoinase B/oxoprolinase/acetone carboxylase alpha subunit
MSVEVKIGIDNNPRELAVNASAAIDDVQAKVAAALDGTDAVLELVDEKGSQVLIPSSKIAYVEIGSAETRRVGFGA